MTLEATTAVKWFRRPPPSGFDRFQRGVWWTGHGQLFIALAFAIVGPALMIGYQVAEQFLHFHDWAFVWGLFLSGMAAPFLMSGVMLRSYAKHARRLDRALWLAGTILGIAVLAIIATFVSILVLLMAVAQILNAMAQATMQL